jgi:hypothetical protein
MLAIYLGRSDMGEHFFCSNSHSPKIRRRQKFGTDSKLSSNQLVQNHSLDTESNLGYLSNKVNQNENENENQNQNENEKWLNSSFLILIFIFI